MSLGQPRGSAPAGDKVKANIGLVAVILVDRAVVGAAAEILAGKPEPIPDRQLQSGKTRLPPGARAHGAMIARAIGMVVGH